MWPPVSSPATPRPIHRTRSTPRFSANTASVPARAELLVARLFAVEQALFGGKQRALAVDVDRAAFTDEAPLADARLEALHAQVLRDRAARGLVEVVVAVARPAVEAKLHGRHLHPFLGSSHHERGHEVARPGAVGFGYEEVDLVERHARALQRRGRFTLHGLVANDQAHALRRGQVARHLAEYPADRRKLPREVARLVWPGQPGRRVGLPLRRHAEAERARRLFRVRPPRSARTGRHRGGGPRSQRSRKRDVMPA